MSITPQTNNVDTNQYKKYALAIHKAGFNVLPMRPGTKAPNLSSWKEFYTERQTEQAVNSFHWASGNISIINGINAIRTLDLDGCTDAEVLFKLLELMGIEPGYQWVVHTPGKGGGFHIYIQCTEDLTLTTNSVLVGNPRDKDTFEHLELRWSHCITMFPPSIHPDTHTPYEWAFGVPEKPIAVVPLALVQKAFLTLATPQKSVSQASSQASSQAATPRKSTVVPDATKSPKVARFDVWAQKALEQEISILRSAPSGQRNNQLNKSAFNLGQIVGSGMLDATTVEQELARCAQIIGLDDKECTATIKSGLDAGQKKPRMPKQIFKENEPPLALPPIKNVDDEKLASFTPDDQGHAEAVFSLYGPYIAYNDAAGWLIWNGTNYVPSIQRINKLIVEVLRLRMRAAAHLERADLAKVSKSMAGTVSATRTMLENIAYVDVEEFDNEPDLINTLSGIINLRTKTLIPHDPAYRFTWCAPVRYNPSADSSLWLHFVQQTVGTSEMISYLQQALGYSITGHTSEEALFYIYGPPRSGKGTLSETILAIFPRPIAIEVDFNTFTQKREGDSQNFDLAPMKPARLVFASESNKYQSLNPAKVKALTGGNLVHCAHKYGAFFSYKPQYAVWLSSNHEVNGDPDDDALWGRVKVIHFPNSRLGHEDKSLKRRMQAPENLEAVLAWLVEGAYQWYQHEGEGLQTPDSVRDLTLAQRSGQDSVGLWLEECCEKTEGEWTEHNKLMLSYKNWCEANGYEPKKAKAFTQSIAAHGFQVGVQKYVYTSPGTRIKKTGILGLQII